MLSAKRSATQETGAEVQEAAAKEDAGIVPLGISDAGRAGVHHERDGAGGTGAGPGRAAGGDSRERSW